MHAAYIYQFADLMEQSEYPTALYLAHQLQAIADASKIHIGDLRGGRTEYTWDDPMFLRLEFLLYTANIESHDLLVKIRPELERYMDNMRILYQQSNKKYDALYEALGDHEAVETRIGEDVLQSWAYLEDFVGDHEEQDAHDKYLTEIFQFWRRYGGRLEHQYYEDVWQFVAGRPLPSCSD